MPERETPAENIHGTAILIGDRGVLVTGPSGSGKTTLALALVDHYGARGVFARLIADDQLFIASHAGRVVGHVPATIAGLAEITGLGPRPVPFVPSAVIDLCLRLIPGNEMERFQPNAEELIAGCAVPRIDLAERNVTAALPAVATLLRSAAFG